MSIKSVPSTLGFIYRVHLEAISKTLVGAASSRDRRVIEGSNRGVDRGWKPPTGDASMLTRF